MIETEYTALDQPRYRNFNATLLNETAAIVNATLVNGTVNAANYLFATLIASNATGDGSGGADSGTGTAPSNDSGSSGGSNPRSSLAM